VGFYDRYIVPPLLGLACGTGPIRHQRSKIVPQAEGTVLELGFGSGLNLPHYDRSKVDKLFALEPAPGMLKRARKAAKSAGFPVEILAETAETLSLAEASVDTVLVTYSLCTIPDPVTALAASRRALRPGGQLLFCEHGRAPDAEVQRRQEKIEPWWKVIAGGCHLCRDIPRLVCDAGFEIQKLETMYLPKTPPWAGFNYWGSARAGSAKA
jgi:SAM-dependent methyltransferase